MKNNLYTRAILPILSLFTSFGTLICCALPALFVTLGLGAAVAGFAQAMPWIITLSVHKTYLFAGSGVLLSMASFVVWRGKNLPCPSDPEKAKACAVMRKVSIAILIFSITIYAVGFFFAFIAADLFFG